MSAVSVLLAPRDEALGERIADALSRGGHKARVLTSDHGDLDLEEDLGDDAAIVIWSKAALKLARLRDQARDALTRGSLIPVAIGGAPAPDGFEELQPVDLSGWQGDDRDPRWRFVLEEISMATERRRLADQDIWVTAQQAAAVQASPETLPVSEPSPSPKSAPADVDENEILESVRPAPSAAAPLRRRRRRARRFKGQTVAVVGVMALCVMSGVAIILAPNASSDRMQGGEAAALRDAPAADLAVLQPATPVPTDVSGANDGNTDQLGDAAAPAESGAPLFVPQQTNEDRLVEGVSSLVLATAPTAPIEKTNDQQPEDAASPGPGSGESAAAEAPPAPDTMETLLASVPELQDQLETPPPAIAQPEYAGDFFRDCIDCPDMAALSVGAFAMGATPGEGGRPSELPQTAVTISTPFAIATKEVTFDQWQACVADGGCAAYAPPDFGWGRGEQPVVAVSFNDAQTYVAWLSAKTGRPYRLPSEAEWEFAARAGSTTAFSFGDGLSADQANYDGRYAYRGAKARRIGRPTVASTYAPNPFGLFDMHGNVWEWTADCWNDTHAGAPTNGSARGGACVRRVLKGGAFNTGGWRLRSAHRIGKDAGAREQEIGFRVVRDL